MKPCLEMPVVVTPFFEGFQPAVEEVKAVAAVPNVEVAAKKSAAPRRAITETEAKALSCLGQVTYTPGSWDKRFARNMAGMTLVTEKEAAQIWRLFKRYRRQITHAEKTVLLEMAEQLAAPELRRTGTEIESWAASPDWKPRSHRSHDPE